MVVDAVSEVVVGIAAVVGRRTLTDHAGLEHNRIAADMDSGALMKGYRTKESAVRVKPNRQSGSARLVSSCAFGSVKWF